MQSTIAEIEERARQSREAMDAVSRTGGQESTKMNVELIGSIKAKEESKTEKVERPEWMLKPPEIDYLRNGKRERNKIFD